MNNLLSQTMGQGLDNMASAFQAVLALLLLPAYWVMLAALGAFLYFHSRRLRVEPVHDIRLRVDPALSQSAREGQAKQRRGLFNKQVATSQGTQESHENTASVQGKSSALNRQDPLAEGAEQGLLANPGGSQEGLPPISIHDAPLLILAGALVLGLAFALTLLTATTGDPLTSLLGGSEARNGLMRFLVPSERNSFLPMVLYTVAGGLLLVVLPLILKGLMSLEWVHTEPTSPRTRRLKRMWRSACMVDFHRLDGSVETWLTPLLPIYVLLLFFADVTSLYLSLAMPPAIMAAAHLLPVSLVRLFGPVWGMRVRWERKERDIQRRIPVGSLVDHLWQDQFLGTLLVKPISKAPQEAAEAPAQGAETAFADAAASPATSPAATEAGAPATDGGAGDGEGEEEPPPPRPREDQPPLIQQLQLPATNPVSLHDSDLPTRLEHGLALLQRRDLAPFLAHALRQLFEDSCSVVLSGPQGSGRTELLLLCALEVALRGGSTLIVVNDRRQTRRLMEDLEWLAGEYPAFRLVHAQAADGAAMRNVDKDTLLLDILVVDLTSIEGITNQPQRLDAFWARLDLVVMPEVDEASPLTRLEFPYLLSHITALSSREPDRLPVLVSVLAGGWKEYGDLSFLLQRPHVEIPLGGAVASRLTLIPFKPLRLRVEDLVDDEDRQRQNLVDPLLNQALEPIAEPAGTPVLIGEPAALPEKGSGEEYEAPEQLVRRAVQEQDLLPIFAAALAEAGYPRFYLSSATHPAMPATKQSKAAWSRRARDFTHDEVVISLVSLCPETFFRQLAEIRELSQSCVGGRHLCFLMPPVDGHEEALHRQIVPLLTQQGDMLAPVVGPAWTNPLLERKHLLGAILGGARDEHRLRTCFGDVAVSGLLERADAGAEPVVRQQDLLRDAYLEVDRTRMCGPTPPALEAAPVGGALGPHPVRVVCRELGLEGLIDAERQASVLYPGRIFCLEGQRVRVVGKAHKGLLTCVPEPLDKSTTKIRQVVVRGDQDVSLSEDHIFNNHGIGILHAQVNVRELIIGCRTWSWFREEPLQESLFGANAEVSTDYSAHAAVIFLPGVTERMAHLFAHMLKRYLKLATGDTADQLDVTHGCFQPFSKGVQDFHYLDVTVLDSVPGGSGLCQLVTPDLLRRLAAHVKALHESGARWSHIRDCQAPQRLNFASVDPTAEGPSLDTATDLVDFLETMLLKPEDRDIDAIDYSCNLWTPEPRQDPLPSYPMKQGASTVHEQTTRSAEQEDAPMRELLWRVHADVNRLRPLAFTPSDKETP